MDAIKDFFTTILYIPLFNALIFLAWLVPGHSIGWAIIILTVLIRLALLPSTIKTFEQQRRIRELQPKVKELKEVHGDDKAAHSKAVMELYAAEKVSPFGGCLPTLIQIPILLVLYRVFIDGLHTDNFKLLYSFTPRPETLNTDWLGIDLSKPEMWILPIVVGVLQYIQIRQTTQLAPMTTPGEQGQEIAQIMSKQMVIIFPLIAWFTARSFPAGLALYYATFSLFMIAQQAWQMRMPSKSTASAGSAVTAGGAKTSDKKSETKGGVTVTVRRKNSGG